MRVSTGPVALAFGTIALLGVVPTVIKAIHAGPWTVAVVRLLIGAIGIGLLGSWRGELRWPGRRNLWALAQMGLCFGLHWITYFYSIKLSTPSLANVALSIYGPCVMVWGWVLLRRAVRGSDLVGLVLALAGMLLCVPHFSLGDGQTAGFLIGLASGVIYALMPILQQRAPGLPVTLKAFGQFGFALIAFLPFLGQTNWNLDGRDWLGLLFLGIGGTFIAHTLWVHVTTKLPLAAISVVSYGQVPMAMFFSVLLLGEQLRWQLIAGAALIVLGNAVGVLYPLYRQRVVSQD